MKKSLLGLLALSVVGLTIPLTSCATNETSNVITIGLECNYVPFNWTETNANEFTLGIANKPGKYADGYDIQIAKLIGQHLNKEVVIMQTAWESLIPDLQFDSVDLIIAGMTDTPERRQTIDFSDEYYRSELVLITKKEIAEQYTTALSDSELGELLQGKDLVSQRSTVTNDVLEIFHNKYNSNTNPALQSFAHCAQDVVSGISFAMTAELPVAEALVGANPTLGIIHIDQNILGETQSELGVSIGIKKGNDTLKASVNEALASITSETKTQLMIEAVERSKNF